MQSSDQEFRLCPWLTENVHVLEAIGVTGDFILRVLEDDWWELERLRNI